MSVITDATKDGISSPYVSHTGHMEQGPGQVLQPPGLLFEPVPVASEVLQDRSISASARILLWLMAHGSSAERAVQVSQSTLMRDLRAARSTIHTALRYLAQVGYIVIEHNPLLGRVFAYRLVGIGGAHNGR